MPKPAGRGFESVKITEHVCCGHGSLTTDAYNDSDCFRSNWAVYSAGLLSVQHSDCSYEE